MRNMVSICMVNLVLLANFQALSYANLADVDQGEPVQTLQGGLEYDYQNVPRVSVPEPAVEPVITELNFDQYIDVKTTKIDLESKYLSSKFSAYRVNLTNNTPYTLEMIQANTINAYDGKTAYGMVKNNPFAIRRIRLSYSYIGVATSVLRGGFAIIRNKKAKEESLMFSDIIPKQTLTKGKTIEFSVLVPSGEKPKIFIKYYQPEIEKIYYSHLF
jgi:hypothetical protein